MHLVVKDYSVKLNNETIIEKVNFSIRENETIVIGGTNGSGKSTLIKSICGFGDYSYTGSLILNKKDISKLSAAERAQMGMFLCLQEPIEIKGLSYAEMLKAALSIRGEINARDFQLRLAQNLELLRLNPFMAQKHIASDLSGGEKKKMEILQILMLEPKIIFLDEIDSGLDAKSASLISDILNDYQKQHKASFVIITHNNRILEKMTINNKYQIQNKTLLKIND